MNIVGGREFPDFKEGDGVVAVQDGNKPRYNYNAGDRGVVVGDINNDRKNPLFSNMTVRLANGDVIEACACYKFDLVSVVDDPKRKQWARRVRNGK